jgi:hypothetical protein
MSCLTPTPEDNWEGFPFLFALCVSASLVIWFGVDVQKGRRDAVRFADEKRADKHASANVNAHVSEVESEDSRKS